MTHCYKKEYMNDDLVVWTWLTPQGLLTMTVEFFSNLKLELVWCVDTPWLSDSCRSLPPCVRITPFLPVPPCCDPPALPAVVDSPDVWVPPHKSRDMILWLDGGVVSHSSSCTLFPFSIATAYAPCIASLHLSALPARDSSSCPFVENIRSTGQVGSWPKRRKNEENPVYSCTIALVAWTTLFKCYFQFDFWASSGVHNIPVSVLLKRSAGLLGWETNGAPVLILFTSALCCLYRAFPMDSTTPWWHYSVHSCMFYSMDFGLRKRKSASRFADLLLYFRVNP